MVKHNSDGQNETKDFPISEVAVESIELDFTEKSTAALNSNAVRDWVAIKKDGNEWYSDTIFVSPSSEKAKIYHCEIAHWGYHDESDSESYGRVISIEQALRYVYPDIKAIERIQSVMGKDFSLIVEHIEKQYFKPILTDPDEVLDISAVLLEKSGSEVVGKLTVTPDRFSFETNDSSNSPRIIRGALKAFPEWHFSCSFGRNQPYYNNHPEKRTLSLYMADGHSITFRVPEESVEAVCSYGDWFRRQHQLLTEYKALQG